MKFQEIKVPAAMVCPACEHPITNASPTRKEQNPAFRKGTVILCSNCTSVLQVGDSSLQIMRPEQVNALSPRAKEAILSARLVLQRILSKKKKS